MARHPQFGDNPDVGRNVIPIRLGAVGFGKVVRDYYLPSLLRSRGVQLVAVADPLQSCRNEAEARIPGVRVYPSHHELLQQESLDGVLVASPPSTHLHIWDDLSKRRIPTFMEKPFVLAGELNHVMSTREARAFLMVNLNRRLWPAYRRLGEMARSGSIGDLEHAEFVLHVNILKWSSVTQHRLLPSEGGPLYDLGSQVLDLVYTVFEREPVRIHAERLDDRSGSHNVKLTIDLPDEITVRCDLAYGKSNRERVCIWGKSGHLRIDNPNMAIHLFPDERRRRRLAYRIQDALLFGYRGIRRGRSMLRYTIGASLKSFVNAIRAHQPFSPGFDDAVKNALWLEAASQSLVSGKPELVHDVKERLICPA